MINKILRRYLNNKGMVSIYTVVLLSFLLPFLLFTVIDLNHYMQQNRRLKNIVDDAGASAITMINEAKLSKGKIEIDPVEAQNIVNRIVKENLFLNADLTPASNSILSGSPTVQVFVVNNPPAEGQVITTPNETVNVKKPSVVVYAKFPVKGLFSSKLSLNIEKTGMSQAQFK